METVDTSCKNSDAFAATMKLVGDYWTLRIVDAVRDDEVRFCEIERRLPEINPATLTSRLKKLEDAGMIDRLVETKDKQSVSYILTSRGKQLLPVLESIQAFTEQ